MSSAIVALVIAVVGVCGTLASAIFTQRLSQRARLEELGRTERLRLADQEAADNKSKTDQLRSCYVLQRIQSESEASVREPLLDEIIELLDDIMPLLSRARVVMRMDLGVIDKPPDWYQPTERDQTVKLAQERAALYGQAADAVTRLVRDELSEEHSRIRNELRVQRARILRDSVVIAVISFFAGAIVTLLLTFIH